MRRFSILGWAVTALAALALAGVPDMGFAEDLEGYDFTERSEEDAELAYGFGLDVLSSYIRRGIVDDEGTVLQGAAWLKVAHLKLAVWGNMALNDVDSRWGSLSEARASVAVAVKRAGFGLSGGLVGYLFPETGTNTEELFVTLSYDWTVTPSVGFYYDIDQAEGLYILSDLSYRTTLAGDRGEGVALEFVGRIHLGVATSNWNDRYYEVDHNAITDVGFGVALPLHAGLLTFTPSVRHVSVVEKVLRRAAPFDHDNIVVGLSAKATFW